VCLFTTHWSVCVCTNLNKCRGQNPSLGGHSHNWSSASHHKDYSIWASLKLIIQEHPPGGKNKAFLCCPPVILITFLLSTKCSSKIIERPNSIHLDLTDDEDPYFVQASRSTQTINATHAFLFIYFYFIWSKTNYKENTLHSYSRLICTDFTGQNLIPNLLIKRWCNKTWYKI